MALWQIFVIVGIIFLLLEIFAPMMFFLNFAIGAFLTAIVAIYVTGLNVLVPFFVVLSILLLVLFRPLLSKHVNGKKMKTGLDEQYIGKIVKAIEPINGFSGAVTIYGERWEARSLNKDETFEKDSEVKISKNESLLLYVEKAE